MRKITLIAVMLGIAGAYAHQAQDGGKEMCKAYIPLEKGTILKYEEYDKKDKLTSTQTMTVIDVLESETSLAVDIHMDVQGEKKDEHFENDVTYTCENGVFIVNMENMINPESMEGMKEMEIKMEQEDLYYPATMEVGQTLPDAHINMEFSMNGMKVMSMNVDITERKVEAIENMETSAGTFPCVKISFMSTTTMMMGDVTTKTVEWIAPNVGVVRSETYKKDELESYRILTSLVHN